MATARKFRGAGKLARAAAWASPMRPQSGGSHTHPARVKISDMEARRGHPPRKFRKGPSGVATWRRAWRPRSRLRMSLSGHWRRGQPEQFDVVRCQHLSLLAPERYCGCPQYLCCVSIRRIASAARPCGARRAPGCDRLIHAGDQLSMCFTVEIGHLPSCSLIEMRSPCTSSRKT